MTRMTDLTAAKEALSAFCGGAAPVPVLAAVSGGLDSMCLLHLLTDWGREQGLDVTAAHFNHQLRGRSPTGTRSLSGTGAPPTGSRSSPGGGM